MAGKDHDEIYSKLYFGEPFTVTDERQVLPINIPMDPTGTDWNQEAKKKSGIGGFFKVHQVFIAHLFNFLFGLGMIASVLFAVIDPSAENIIIAALYFIILILGWLGVGPVTAGRIMKNGAPLANAMVRVFSAGLQVEVAHKATTAAGSYYVLVPKADYYVAIQTPDGKGGMTTVFTSKTFHTSRGVINKNFNL